jgi:transposase
MFDAGMHLYKDGTEFEGRMLTVKTENDTPILKVKQTKEGWTTGEITFFFNENTQINDMIKQLQKIRREIKKQAKKEATTNE